MSREWDIVPLGLLPGLRSLERLVHTPTQVPSWPARIQAPCGERRAKGTESRPCRSKSGVKTGLDMKEVVSGCKGCSVARPSDERVGDFVQHEVALNTYRSGQHQQKTTIINGKHGVVGMLMVQRARLVARDEECSTTASHQHRNVGLDDLR
ncbi:hypothetical protein N7535_005903 [Penicillium sp. DV-2018c]|nr:hypothetical protein N7461_009482 [Penicillium sp. DV-2018c]KAJ5572243.1 hypothetical protein N7535_005903 [Penicillium sp. DV-2018c]